MRVIFQNTYCGDDPVQCTGPRLIDRLSWEHMMKNPACGPVFGCIVRLPFAYFSPNIARWNAGNMVKKCRVDFDYPDARRRRTKELHACRALEKALQYPEALQSPRQTYAVHHWQCSWCRQDDTLRRSVPIHEVYWLAGNISAGLVPGLRQALVR